MVHWFAWLLTKLDEAIRYALSRLEQKQVVKAVKQYADSPLSDRWYRAWYQHNHIAMEDLTEASLAGGEASTTSKGTDKTVGKKPDKQSLSDTELETLITNFYEKPIASVRSRLQSPKDVAKQRLLEQKKSDSYITRIAEAVRETPVAEPVTSVAPPVEQATLAGKPVNPAEPLHQVPVSAWPMTQLETPTADELLQHLPTQRQAESVLPDATPTVKRFGRVHAVDPAPIGVPPVDSTSFERLVQQSIPVAESISRERSFSEKPNPLAHLAAKNHFLADRINRLANQYFEETETEEETLR